MIRAQNDIGVCQDHWIDFSTSAMVNNDFQAFFKMPIICQSMVPQNLDPHLDLTTDLSISRDHSSSNTVKISVSYTIRFYQVLELARCRN